MDIFLALPSLLAPFESGLIRWCEVGWSSHIFQILPGVFSMKNHKRATCEAQRLRSGFLFHSPNSVHCREIFSYLFGYSYLYSLPQHQLFLTWSLDHTTPVLKHFLHCQASCSRNLSHHHIGFLPFHLGSHSVIPCCPIFRYSIPNIS